MSGLPSLSHCTVPGNFDQIRRTKTDPEARLFFRHVQVMRKWLPMQMWGWRCLPEVGNTPPATALLTAALMTPSLVHPH
ncbi:unnamed protein product [Protopolystoma xenopodis]|uniref:Uncharacterized protein n=1 Tax=Protopolystoma xenopodis TaxID=117903 RepID=A0A448X1K8_9PLAT|nr:unnamed protein product [Protopolystoma xenopodis]